MIEEKKPAEKDIVPFEGCPYYLRQLGDNIVSEGEFDVIMTKKGGANE